MTQPNLLELAKQGKPKAIAALMNRQLQPKGITAKVAIEGECLKILLETTQIPDQNKICAFIQNGLKNLNVDSIKHLKIYCREIGQKDYVWQKSIQIKAIYEPIEALSQNDLTKPGKNSKDKASSLQKISSNQLLTKEFFFERLLQTKTRVLRGKQEVRLLDLSLLLYFLLFLLFCLGLLLSQSSYGFHFYGFIYVILTSLVGTLELSCLIGLLALIPAFIANKKGQPFIRWWFYSFLIL